MIDNDNEYYLELKLVKYSKKIINVKKINKW